jgi:branched-chain amino acid transport system permease protein
VSEVSLALSTPAIRIQRWTRLSASFTSGTVLVLVAFAFVPVLLSQNLTQKLTSLFILAILAAMWNALAGYGGLVSVGQQAFIGIGAYGTVFLADKGVKPYLAMVLAALIAAAVSVPISFVVLRFRAAQFAIGMWVVAEAFAILVSLDASLGAGTGTSLIELNYYSPDARQSYTYWLTFGSGVLLLGLVFMLLRSRLGASLQAIRDDEEAAASVGVRVAAGKRILFVIAAGGCGIAGACILANQLFITPTSIFSVQYTAYMIFMALVGGLGTFEGPIIGAIVLFFIQQEFGNNGVWYLVGLGVTAIVFALALPRGIWGTIEERLGLQLMPVGYRVRRSDTASGADAPVGGEAVSSS